MSILGAFGGSAAAKLQQGQSDVADATRQTGHKNRMASLDTTEAVYDGIIVIKQVAKEIKDEFAKTREWVGAVQENVNGARGQIESVQNGTNTLLEMAQKGEADHVKIAEAFNAMSDVVGELVDQVKELRAEVASLRGKATAE